MKYKIAFPIVAISLMLTLALPLPVSAQPQNRPRMNIKYMKEFFSSTGEFADLQSGTIDVMDVPLTPAQLSSLLGWANLPGTYGTINVENAQTTSNPIWTAYLNGWRGVVNQYQVGVKNWYTGAMAYNPTTGATTLRVGLHNTVSWLNPVTTTSDVDWNVLWEIYDPLIRSDPYNPNYGVPLGLADDWRVDTWASGTLTLLKFHLRPNAVWHSGAPVTVSDVVFSILYHKSMMGTFYSNVIDVNSVTPFASNWVYVYMNVLNPATLRLVGSVPILQQAIWQLVPNAFVYYPEMDDANGNGVVDLKEDGSGPWVFDHHVINDHVLLLANTSWYLTTGPDNPATTTLYDLGDVERCVMEAFHRRGDVDYDADLDIIDLIIIAMPFSSLPYQTVPLWTDDQYSGLMYSPAGSPAPYITGWAQAFDWIGVTGTNWYTGSGIFSPPFQGNHPWRVQDINYDNYDDLVDLTIFAVNWGAGLLGRRAGSGW